MFGYKKKIHHHKYQGLDTLIRSVYKVTTALSNVSSVFQLFSFLVVCSSMILKGFGFVVFFARVETSSVYSFILSSMPVICRSRRLSCGHKGCSLPEVSITSFLPLQFFVFVRLLETKNWSGRNEVIESNIQHIFLCISATCFGYLNVAITRLYRITKRNCLSATRFVYSTDNRSSWVHRTGG